MITLERFMKITSLIFIVLVVLLPLTSVAEIPEKAFELKPGESSVVYNRDPNAEYFWWDANPQVKAEIEFFDGTKLIAGTDAVFSKKIVAVKFINPTKEVQKVVLKQGF